MKDKYNIKEVSEILNISKSTLRYWDSEKLVQMERNQLNDYREYNIKQIVDISDIAFYRSINVPITKLKKVYEMNLAEFDQILDDTQKDIDLQIAELKKKRKGIMARKEKIRELERLLAEPYTISIPDMSTIVEYDIKHFAEIDPYDFAIVISDDSNSVQYGAIISNNPNTKDILWEKSKISNPYIQCLLQISVDNPEINNLEEHLEHIENMGYRTGILIGRYLITATENIRYEYYKVWIEILD